ncbi:MAG TPA: hypothetical protein VFQ35_06990, partial [Polyangiaceae bacterium]|nr:hypothetical protein [Polyangiaceae bacterium]
MMSPRLASCFLVCAIACTRRASSPAEAGGDAAPSSPPPAPARPEELKQMCDAGGLPQIDETAVGAEPLLTAAERGTVALRWDGAHAAFTEGCSLPGAYTELPGSGGGRFFGTNRVTLRVDEVPP